MPVVRPRTPVQPGSQLPRVSTTYPYANPYTPPIPIPTENVPNLAACVHALKASVESLIGQRGDASNRAVTFNDLMAFGLLDPAAVSSPIGGEDLGGGAGNQTITLSGDLTGSGTTSIDAQIAANAVGTTEIANSNVTYGKIQNTSAARLLGNPTGSAASPSEISLGSGLSFAGSVLNATGSGITQADADLRYVNVTGDTMTGALTIATLGGWSTLFLNSVNGTARTLRGTTSGSLRWDVNLGDFAAESSGNVGTNFSIQRYSDAGGDLGTALSISRATGNATFGGAIAVTNADFAPTADFKNSNLTAGNNCVRIMAGPNASDTTTALLNFFNAPVTAQLGSVIRNGINSVSYTTTSDERLKENIQPTAAGLSEVMQIHVRDYSYKGDRRVEQGVLAQEISELYPVAVHSGGDDPQLEPWLIDYGRLTPLLIKAIQELAAKVQALESNLGVTGGPPAREV